MWETLLMTDVCSHAELRSHPSLTSHGSHASQREGHYVSSDGTLAASTSYGRCSPGVEAHKRANSDSFAVPMGGMAPRSRSGTGVEDPGLLRLYRDGSESKWVPDVCNFDKNLWLWEFGYILQATAACILLKLDILSANLLCSAQIWCE